MVSGWKSFRPPVCFIKNSSGYQGFAIDCQAWGCGGMGRKPPAARCATLNAGLRMRYGRRTITYVASVFAWRLKGCIVHRKCLGCRCFVLSYGLPVRFIHHSSI